MVDLSDEEADAHRLVRAWGFYLGRPGQASLADAAMAVADAVADAVKG